MPSSIAAWLPDTTLTAKLFLYTRESPVLMNAGGSDLIPPEPLVPTYYIASLIIPDGDYEAVIIDSEGNIVAGGVVTTREGETAEIADPLSFRKDLQGIPRAGESYRYKNIVTDVEADVEIQEIP